MSDPSRAENYTVTIVSVTEGGRVYSLEAAARLAGVHPDMLRHYCQLGLLGETHARADDEPTFDDNALYELRRIEYYRRHHGVSRRSLPLLCGLWREVERLRAEVRFLRDP